MGFAQELTEAVDALSIPEQVSFLDTLDEHVTTALHTGYFTEETMEAAFVAILRESGYFPSESTDAEVFEAIEEYLDEELGLFERDTSKAKALAKKHGKGLLKSIGREVVKSGAKPLAKHVTKIKTKSKTGKMLKHAAAGAIKQIGRDPGKAKEVLKKSAKRAGKKLIKAGVKKGMKMVFGKWLKTEAEEIHEARRKRSKKQDEIDRILAKRGTIRLPSIDKNEYPPIRGMEGPFRFRDGRTLYYDPRKGRYYDRKTDMYLAFDDIPEDAQLALSGLVDLVEVHG